MRQLFATDFPTFQCSGSSGRVVTASGGNPGLHQSGELLTFVVVVVFFLADSFSFDLCVFCALIIAERMQLQQIVKPPFPSLTSKAISFVLVFAIVADRTCKLLVLKKWKASQNVAIAIEADLFFG